jgi:L-asparaginase
VSAAALRVHLIATGGTIAMAGNPARPARSGEELVAAIPELAEVAEVRVEQLSNVPGVELAPGAMAQAIAAAAAAVEEGAAGAVIVQGTDTIEETADLADLVWTPDAPLVVTGAMRPAGTAGADGPANLLDAIRVAASPAARGLGAVVVFDGLVHAGSQAVKSHSWRPAAFSSPAPLGEVREGELRLAGPRERPKPISTPAEAAHAVLDGRVPIVAAAAGAGPDAIDAVLDRGAEAIVVISLGAGHLPAAMLPGVERALAAGLPVVVCARPAEGGTLADTYGFEGSETDLARRGAILAGPASAWKARIRLLLALALDVPPRDLFPQ